MRPAGGRKSLRNHCAAGSRQRERRIIGVVEIINDIVAGIPDFIQSGRRDGRKLIFVHLWIEQSKSERSRRRPVTGYVDFDSMRAVATGDVGVKVAHTQRGVGSSRLNKDG